MLNILSARTSFWRGVVRAFDVNAVFEKHPRLPDEDEAVAQALRSDWEAIGADMYKAIREIDDHIVRKDNK